MCHTHSQCQQEMRDLDLDDVLTYHMTMTACMESGTTQIWNGRKDFVWIFVDRNLMRSCFCFTALTLLSRLEMGNLPRPLAGTERSDGRPRVGRLEPSKGPFSPVPSENQEV